MFIIKPQIFIWLVMLFTTLWIIHVTCKDSCAFPGKANIYHLNHSIADVAAAAAAAAAVVAAAADSRYYGPLCLEQCHKGVRWVYFFMLLY